MKKIRLALLAVLVSFVSMSYAQDINAAGAKFNEGLELDKAKNYAGAIKAWVESVSMCDALGADADQLKATVQEKLAYTYFKEGITQYKKKNFDGALKALKSAEKLATAINDTKTQNQAGTYIPKVYSTKGLTLMSKKDYAGAIKVFDEALEYNPQCVDAFYGKGMTYKEMEDMDQAAQAFEKVIEYGTGKSAAEKKVESAREAAQKMFEAKAATELQIEHNDVAVDLLNNALKFNNQSVNAYYLLALANNKLKKYDAAVEAAENALSLPGVDVSAVSFELGKAYEAKGDKTNACTAYKQVTSGPNVEAAKFQLAEVLKCN